VVKWYTVHVNGFRYYRALESVSIASVLSSALTIYPCQIRVHQRWRSKLQLPTARKKEWRPATADSSPPCGYLSTLLNTTLVGLEPDRWFDALPVVPPSQPKALCNCNY